MRICTLLPKGLVEVSLESPYKSILAKRKHINCLTGNPYIFRSNHEVNIDPFNYTGHLYTELMLFLFIAPTLLNSSSSVI